MEQKYYGYYKLVDDESDHQRGINVESIIRMLFKLLCYFDEFSKCVEFCRLQSRSKRLMEEIEKQNEKMRKDEVDITLKKKKKK